MVLNMAPDAPFSNTTDINEFTKFSKFLAYKGVQIIVESRKGVKIEENKKYDTSDNTWFNLQIPDTPEVTEAVKNILPSDRVLEVLKDQLHVEISIQTDDSDEIALELWSLTLDETQLDSTLKTMTMIYFKMGILLKSLITISRITPAYKLSKEPESVNFTMFYKLYTGEPKLKNLGETVKTIQVGLLKTPLGGLSFSVTYRTNFSINRRDNKSEELILKSDHFDFSPKHIILECKYFGEEKNEIVADNSVDLNKLLKFAAFVDEAIVQKAIEDFYTKIPLPKCTIRMISNTVQKNISEPKSTELLDKNIVSKGPTTIDTPKKFPGICNENEPPMKLLYFPFADNHPLLELAEFYKDFFNAPKLLNDLDGSLSAGTELSTRNVDLSKDLVVYENSVHEFDELLEEMCGQSGVEIKGTM